MPTASPVRPAGDAVPLTIAQAVAAEPAPARRHEFYSKFAKTVADGRAHIFLFHNNVGDYVEADLDVEGYLITAALKGKYAVVAQLSIADGITLLMPGMARLFDQWSFNGPEEDPSLAEVRRQRGSTDDYEAMALPPKSDILGQVELLLTFLRRAPKGKAVVVIENVEMLFPEQPLGQMQTEDRAALELLTKAARDDGLNARVNPIFMLTGDLAKVHGKLTGEESGIHQIEVTKPEVTARRIYIDSYLAARLNSEDGVPLEMEMSAQELALGTAGLLCRHLQDLFMESYGELLTWDMVRATRKRLLYAMYGDVLRLMEDRVDWESVGGHAEVKRYLLRIVDAMKRGESDICPQNVAMAGPPGTGKTYIMKALAYLSKMNVIFIDLSLIKGQYVGNTEKAWRRLWEAIVTFGKCIVVFDEADTKVDRAGSNSADAALFGAILENFGDPKYRGEILGVFITNVPRKLDPALLSRCMILPVLPTEPVTLLTAVLRSAGYAAEPDMAWVIDAAPKIEGWDGREVAKVVTEATASVRLDGLTIEAAMLDTLDNWNPGKNEDVTIMTDMAIAMTSNLKLIPARYRQARKTIDPAKLEADTDKILGRARGRRDSSF